MDENGEVSRLAARTADKGRPAETWAAGTGALGSLLSAALASGDLVPDSILTAVPAIVGAVPMFTSWMVDRRKASAGPNPRQRQPSAEKGQADPVTNRPAETAATVSGAVATTLAAFLNITDPAIIAALPVMIGAVPALITWIVDPRVKAARLQAELDAMRKYALDGRAEAPEAASTSQGVLSPKISGADVPPEGSVFGVVPRVGVPNQ